MPAPTEPPIHLAPPPPAGRPTGTVTFLFTDVEGSTRRWEHEPAAMAAAWHRQEVLVREAILGGGGWPYKRIGDAFQAAFQTAHAALAAAVAAQNALAAAPWETTRPLRVRMALHTGTTDEWPDDYVGPLLNRVARLLSAGHGGQILLTLATAELVRDSLPAGVALRDLGEHRLKDLTRPEHVWQVVVAGLPAEFPPLRTLDARPQNLPRQATALIGREREAGQVAALLRQPDVTLVTLTGPGGTGKTRLAVQVAAHLLEDFADGVWFVNLAPIIDPDLVVATIATTLEVRDPGGRPLLATLQEHLRTRHLLLLLDNCEQVVAAAPQVGALLAAAPGLKVLATSRIPLGLYGEHAVAVPPLQLPARQPLPPLERLTQYEAVRLFVERATAVHAGFAVTNANAPAVAEICVRLDGLPLAIELAAARVRVLPPEALLARLDQRLRLLTGGSADRPARQQTLRAAIAWSYDLLRPGEQQLFRRLAVFQGGRTLEAIEAVCDGQGSGIRDQGSVTKTALLPLAIDVLDGVQSLVEQSLLQAGQGRDGELRFVMLETIHEFAREALAASGEEAALRNAHLAYFTALADAADPELRGPQQGMWLNRLTDELDNIRAALAWADRQAAADREAGEQGLRLAGGLKLFWRVRGPVLEGLSHLTRALRRAEGGSRAEAQALLAAGNLAIGQGDLDRAEAWLEQAVERWRGLGDMRWLADTLARLSGIAAEREKHPLARAYIDEALRLAQETGDDVSFSHALAWFGIVLTMGGESEAALAAFQDSVAAFRALGDLTNVGINLANLGVTESLQGNLGAARAHLREALHIDQALGAQVQIAVVLAGLGGVAVRAGVDAGRQPGAAVHAGIRVLAASTALTATLGLRLEPMDRVPFEQAIALARGALGEETFAREWAAGQVLALEDALALALEVAGDENADQQATPAADG